ncbi:hypothetical protein JTE90_019001 [Oedothorax gibbosus]|uniref:BTB domain-containing protein n=1 Tax=Oedothorax gibbosus TaxID=931172 RepID=A0AAV6U483_9ARAC|nr:hypothetical protein JTE90_019001 [Oedothorax gibbosus]
MSKIIRWIRKQFAKINTCFRGGKVNNQTDEDEEYADVWDEIIAQCNADEAESQQGVDVQILPPLASETDVGTSIEVPDFERTKERTSNKVVDAVDVNSDVTTSVKEDVEGCGSSTENIPTSDALITALKSIIQDHHKVSSKADDDSESYSTDEDTDDVIPERNVDDQEIKLDSSTTLPSSEPAAENQDQQQQVVDNESPTGSESWSASSDTETSSEEEEELDVIDIFLTEVPPPQNLGFDLVKTVEGKRQEVASDLLIVINEEHEFRVHQEILKEKSRYFEQRLSTKGAFYTAHVDSSLVDPDSLHTALRLLYEGRCEKIHSMFNLHRTALFFGMGTVMTKLQEVVENKQGTLENALANYVFAWDLKAEIEKNQLLESVKDQVSVRDEYRDLATCQVSLVNGLMSMDSSTFIEKGMQTSLDLLAREFEKLVMKSDYLELNFEQIQKLVQQDILGARSEMFVFLAVLKWLDHNYLDREEYAEQLLSCVRFSSMTAEELLACFHPPILMGVMEMQGVKEMLHNALLYITAESLKQERLFKHLASKTRVLLLKEKPIVLWFGGNKKEARRTRSNGSKGDFTSFQVHSIAEAREDTDEKELGRF